MKFVTAQACSLAIRLKYIIYRSMIRALWWRRKFYKAAPWRRLFSIEYRAAY